jgi:hypothetical protein
MPFTRFPDFELMAKAGASGIGGDVQSLLNMLDGALGSVEGLGQTFLGNMASGIASLVGGGGSGSGSGDPKAQLDQASQQSQAQEGQQKAANKKHFQDRLAELGGRVDGGKVVVTRSGGPLDLATKEVERLEGEANKAKDDAAKEKQTDSTNTDGADKAAEDAKKKQAKDAADANKRDLDLAKGRRARIESDIRDADAELKASG